MTLPFHLRLLHQFRHEWRQHRLIALGWTLWLLLRRHPALISATDVGEVVIITILAAATIAWLCVRADAPSNTDTASLTRPIGQSVVWLAKLAFFITAICLPLLIIESWAWRGFGHDWKQYTALSAGWLLSAGIVLGIAAAITALAATTRQVIALGICGLLGAVFVIVLGGKVARSIDERTVDLDTCANLVGVAVCFIGLIAAWWIASVPRRRMIAGVVLVSSLIAAPIVTACWSVNWLKAPPLLYPAQKLTVKTGKADPADKKPGRALWPTLRIVGLGKDEVASIVDFAPVTESAEWPPLGSYSDVPLNTRGYDAWLHHDHVKALMNHSPPATLWNDYLNNDLLYHGRKPLRESISPLRLDPKAPPTRWRLRLAVHEMKPVVTVPYKQLWTQSNAFLIRPGVRVEFDPYVWHFGGWELHGRLHRLRSTVLPRGNHAPMRFPNRVLSDAFLLVLEDPELRENEARDLNITQPGWGEGSAFIDEAWQADDKQGFKIRMWEPAAQLYLLNTKREDWINRLNATLWHAEARGTIDLELSAEQMKEVLFVEPPKTSAASIHRQAGCTPPSSVADSTHPTLHGSASSSVSPRVTNGSRTPRSKSSSPTTTASATST
ncbi:MAG: hypothetical protein K1X78_01165 [Verrucomicrobiaceae bacterium]|nr:hypothetical protein [Verrucomicrobiaceae bacterium]